ncbi:MAG: hypothetical protein ABFD96_04730 [Armatimonadia bacterium]
MRLITTAIALALTGCASLDAAHIAGQQRDAEKFKQYSDVELQKQVAVEACFQKASTDNQMAICALMGTATGMASTFGGRPTNTSIAPTTGQVIQGTAAAVAPYGAAAAIANSVSKVQAKDPVVVNQPEPLVVRPEVVQPTIVQVPAAQ